MSPDEIPDRIAAIEHEQRDLRRIIEEHMQDEEAWRIPHDAKINALYDVFVGAKGAGRVLGWIIVAFGALGTFGAWVAHNLSVTVK